MKNLKVGFTGTKNGTTHSQIRSFRLLTGLMDIDEFHHGDCVGADEQSHEILKDRVGSMIIHPPIDPKYRAWCVGDYMWEEKDYLKRNEDIVNNSDVLIACPRGTEEVRSGTWSTIRFAVKLRKTVIIINREGLIEIMGKTSVV